MKKIIILLGILGLSTAAEQHQLKFNANGKFKMVQFTDIHFGEDEPDDFDNQRLIKDILDQEKPDLAIITGDVISGYMWDKKTPGWAAEQYKNLTNVLIEKQVYWATTAGNHDTEGDLNRTQISELDRSFSYSLTQPNAANISHAFNYFLPVFDESGTDIKFRLWFLDTGHEDCLEVKGWDCIRPDQVEWFRQAHSNITDESKGKGFLFVHIPFSEYMEMINNWDYYGYKGEEVCCGSVNTGIWGALKEQPTIEWVSAGHDHDNDYYGLYQNINLAFGRKTGFGGYGPDHFPRGARVFEVTKEPYGIETWVREDGGNVHREVQPSKRKLYEYPQTQCGGMTTKGNSKHEWVEKVTGKKSASQ